MMRGLLLITKLSLELSHGHHSMACVKTYQFGDDNDDDDHLHLSIRQALSALAYNKLFKSLENSIR